MEQRKLIRRHVELWQNSFWTQSACSSLMWILSPGLCHRRGIFHVPTSPVLQCSPHRQSHQCRAAMPFKCDLSSRCVEPRWYYVVEKTITMIQYNFLILISICSQNSDKPFRSCQGWRNEVASLISCLAVLLTSFALKSIKNHIFQNSYHCLYKTLIIP